MIPIAVDALSFSSGVLNVFPWFTYGLLMCLMNCKLLMVDTDDLGDKVGVDVW